MTAGAFFACDDMMDVHQKYIEGGEIIYSPKVNYLVSYNGKGRVQLQVWLLESPNVRSVDVFWNNYADSLIVPVTPSTGLDVVTVSIPLKEERSYTFYVRTTDIFGNHSLSEMISATSYDSVYASVLTNRGVNGSLACGETEIQWFGIADDYACSEVRYTGVNDEVQIVQVLPNETTTRISDAKAGSTYIYRSLYVPTNSIDTFYTEWEPIEITPALCKFDKSSWSVIAWSDAYTGGGNDGGGVASLIDNNYSTPAWHSGRGGDYNASSFPYWFIIDMGSSREIAKIVTQFANAGRTAKMTCYISNSNNLTTQGDSDSPITDPEACAAWGTKISDTEEWNDAISTVNMLSNATAGQYLLLYMYEAGPNDGDHHTNIYEIDVYGF
jgi:hypothetical protein